MHHQVAITQNEQLKEKVKIRLGNLQSEFLGDFCLKTIDSGLIRDYVLEQCIIAKFYKRYLERFTLMKAGDFTLEAFECIALKRLLLHTPIAEPAADSLRNDLLGILHKEISYF